MVRSSISSLPPDTNSDAIRLMIWWYGYEQTFSSGSFFDEITAHSNFMLYYHAFVDLIGWEHVEFKASENIKFRAFLGCMQMGRLTFDSKNLLQ